MAMAGKATPALTRDELERALATWHACRQPQEDTP
jgi:hypothetical protein